MKINTKNRISFYVITHNEEHNIARCLQSIKDIADEIILVDSFSNDRTVEIAKKFSAQIYKKKYEYDQSIQRNFAISKSSFDWILTIDADETLSIPLKKAIRALVKSNEQDGYWFSRRHYLNGNGYLKYGYFYPDYQLRLFRKRNYKYSGRLHEYLNIPPNKTSYRKLDIYHFAKNPKYDSIKNILYLGWYSKMQSLEYIDWNKSWIFYLIHAIFSLPYHFIGSFIRGKGYLDGIAGLKAAFVFSYLLSAAYFRAVLMKLKLIKYI